MSKSDSSYILLSLVAKSTGTQTTIWTTNDRILPVRSEILEGVLPCDYIGFHTYDYARHFLSACNRVLNLPTMPNAVEYKGRTVNVGTIPIGIDPEKFTDVHPQSDDANPRPLKNQKSKIESLNSNRNSRERK
jgi:trehalose-6-phosphate synthase